MAGLQAQVTETERVAQYKKLTDQGPKVVEQVNKWMTESNALERDSADADEKAEIVALRDKFKTAVSALV